MIRSTLGYSPHFTEIDSNLSPGYIPPTGDGLLNFNVVIRRTVDGIFDSVNPGIIAGITRIAGEYVAGVEVSLHAERNNVHVGTVKSDEDGRFIFEGLDKNSKFYVIMKTPKSSGFEYQISSSRNPVDTP